MLVSFENFRPLITTAAALLSATTMLSLAWRKRADLWVPGEGRASAIWRTVSLGTGVLVAALIIRYEHCSQIRELLVLSGLAIAGCFAALLSHWLFVKHVSVRRGTRAALFDVAIIVLYAAWNVGGTVALTAATIAVMIEVEARNLHQQLTLFVDDRKVDEAHPLHTRPKLPTHFAPHHAGCNNTVKWSIEPSDLGSIENGTYNAPPEVETVRRVKVVAKALDRDWEEAVADIIIDLEIPGVERTTTKGRDDRGNTGVFDVMVITQEHSWICRSEVAIDGDTPGPALMEQLARSHAYDPYKFLIAIGTASHEGPKPKEDARADSRANTLGKWLIGSLKITGVQRMVKRINLGQYEPDSVDPKLPCRLTRSERPLVVIGVITKDDQLDIGVSLRNAFESKRSEAFFKNILRRYRRKWTVEPIDLTR